MHHLLKSLLIFVTALGLLVLTLWQDREAFEQLTSAVGISGLSQPVIYTGVTAVFFDILVLLTEANPITRS